MSNILQFPEKLENAHFDTFLKENNQDPELPLMVYNHLCETLKLPRYELASMSSHSYNRIEGAVNGLLDRAESQGVIDNPHRLIMRRVQ